MKILSIAAIGLCAATLAVSTEKANQERLYVFHHENVLGTSLELKLLASTLEQAEQAEQAALHQIDSDARILSTYDPNSEVSRWLQTAGVAVPVSAELFEVLNLFDQWRDRTGGALDAAAEAVVQVWKKAAAAQREPTSTELAEAVAMVKQTHWKLDAVARTATHLSNSPIRLNSFAKSYIVSRANDSAMASDGITAAVVNIGGDLVVRGRWTETVDVTDPRSDTETSAPASRIAVSGMAVATSGSYRRGVEINGLHYSHIVDPRNGQSNSQAVDHMISATVIAENAVDAGALATTFSILKPEESQRLAASMKGVEYMLIAQNGQRTQSSGWKALERPLMAPAAQAALTTTGAWPTGFELVVNLELATIEGQRTRRPYVAIWIEDKDKFPVKTMALWVQKPRWIADLKAWYHDDHLRNMAEGNDLTASFTSATRTPGKYSLKWDGKDNAGKLVKAGKYTVCLEVAREHGTYQVIRQEMDFSGTARQVPLNGNVEVASASLEYRRISH